MLSRKDKTVILIAMFIAFMPTLIQYAFTQAPPGPNTIEHGEGLNFPTITATDGYYLGAVEVTDILEYPIHYGIALNCMNGTWIAHECAGDPATAGGITLSLRGPSAHNATFIYRFPTVLSSNSTHFQIEFTAWETGGWTQVPVTALEAKTVYWFAVYRP